MVKSFTFLSLASGSKRSPEASRNRVPDLLKWYLMTSSETGPYAERCSSNLWTSRKSDCAKSLKHYTACLAHWAK